MNNKVFRDKATMKKRMRLTLFAITCLFLILIIRLSYIMIVKRTEYATKAEGQWTSEVKIDARRGRILDRNGVELAVSANVYRVDFDLNSIRDFLKKYELTNDDIAPLIANALNMETKAIKDKLETKLPSGAQAGAAKVVRRIEKEQADKVRGIALKVAGEAKEVSISGVLVSPDTKRYYPNGNFLSHVLGSTNVDGQGLTGVELQYNKELSGTPGMRITELTGGNTNIPYTISKFSPPIDGKDITLTVDTELQAFAEKAAEKALVDNKAKTVSILLNDPKSGEILAMVNKPDFNPNKPYEGADGFEGNSTSEKLQKMWRNRLVNDTFEPGSIFKVFTLMSAMEEGLVKETDTFNCSGSLQIGSNRIKCWKTSGHGLETLPEILQNSCNVGFMQVGEKVGKTTLASYINKYGFGQKSGVDLPGEAKGIVKKASAMTDADLATISFGQTNTVNSVQYMAAFNAVANGGYLIQPHIMKEITHKDENGKTVLDESFTPAKKQIMSEANTVVLKDYLERTTTQGGSSKAYIEGYHIGCKTGTAQKINPLGGGYESGKYISSAASFAPVDDPKLSIFISIDSPSNGAYYAGQIVAPVMNELYNDIFNYNESDFNKDESILPEVIVPEVRGVTISEAKKILKDNNLEYNIQGNGSIITDVKPYPGYSVKVGTKINLDSGENQNYNRSVVMPNLKGRTKDSISILLKDLGIEYEIEGQGVVANQSIPKGEIITKGTKVKIVLDYEYGD